MDWLMGKLAATGNPLLFSRNKKKDKESSSPTNSSGPKLYLEESFTRESIHTHMPNLDLPSLEELVTLPFGFPQEEWLAWHTMEFSEQLSMLYAAVTSDCTTTTCPCMSAPGNMTYSWVDEKGKKLKCPAPQYIDYVSSYIHKLVNDQSIFPTKHGEQFPPNFTSLVKKIHRLMFHILAHIYFAHYQRMVLQQLHGHLNTFFAHFMLFNWTFKLVDEKETSIMVDLVQALKAIPQENKENHSESP